MFEQSPYQDFVDRCDRQEIEQHNTGELRGDPFDDNDEEVEGRMEKILAYIECPHEEMDWCGYTGEFRCKCCGGIIECPELEAAGS